MKKSHLIRTSGAILCILITVSAHAALIGVLPATPNGTDWQAYYDDQLDISWTANANINGANTWGNQMAWAAGLNIDGVIDWRLPNMDVNGDGTIVSCTTNQAACKDNEYGHLLHYGAGSVFGSGITAGSPGPFSNVQTGYYWSTTETTPVSSDAWFLHFYAGNQAVRSKNSLLFAWAVHEGNVGAVPIPAAVWLFGSGLLGLVGAARRKQAV